MLTTRVQGGTRAGWRLLKPQNKADWECPSCHARNKFFWRNCPNCGHRRPD
jgi:predicted RNA-binding Zn-ribbon protein involved in translation (DUF1610 family)